MTYLLDVNVIIALIDSAHVSHDAAHAWFQAEGRMSWATCPLTESGVLRIVGHPKYPNTPGSPASVAAILVQLNRLPGHAFWPDDISLVTHEPVDPAKLLTSAQVTDTYLLALAVRNGGQLATLNRRLSTKTVNGGAAALKVIA